MPKYTRTDDFPHSEMVHWRFLHVHLSPTIPVPLPIYQALLTTTISWTLSALSYLELVWKHDYSLKLVGINIKEAAASEHH
jgi:hypothetical protein